VDVPGWVSLTAEKRYEEAARLHRERNPFVQVCARVCYHPCEGKCRRSTLDEPLSIRGVKRYLAEQEEELAVPEIRANAANAARKVAVVGAGPAGLSCAYFLARLGYRPTVYEAEKQAGGMLVQAIPAYRLPRDVLDREIRMVKKMGVEIRTGQRLGRDFTLSDLRKQGAEAVFLAVGAPQGVSLGLGSNGYEVDALEFLKQYNLKGTARVSKNVVVVGGGNAAIDAARTALRLGAKSVTVAYRRTRAEMPAYEEEVAEAEREGVKLELLAAPLGLVEEKGKLTGVRFGRMSLGEFDKSGRRRPVASKGAELVIAADMLIAAIGQSLDAAACIDGVTLKLNEREYLATDPVTGQTSVEWVFAGGDAASGPSSVIEAIAAGERAAVGMDRLMSGEEHAFWREEKRVDTVFDPDADPVLVDRAKLKLIPVARRAGNFDEVEVSWTRNVALCEAKRCLRCDYREEEAAAKN